MSVLMSTHSYIKLFALKRNFQKSFFFFFLNTYYVTVKPFIKQKKKNTIFIYKLR